MSWEERKEGMSGFRSDLDIDVRAVFGELVLSDNDGLKLFLFEIRLLEVLFEADGDCYFP